MELQPDNDDEYISVTINGEKFFSKGLKWSFRNIHLLPKVGGVTSSKLDKTQEKLSRLFRGISVLRECHIQDFQNIESIRLDDVLAEWKKKQKNPIVAAILNRIATNPAETNEILSFVIFTYLMVCLQIVDNSINSYYNNHFYIALVRYNYERIMRNREQSVEYIDPINV